MKKIYFDKAENPCTSVFVKGAEVIPAGSTIYGMPVKEKNAEYERIADKYDIHFIFDDDIPQIDFYTVPWIDIMAADSCGGYIGTVGESCGMDSHAPICYIDKKRKCYIIADNFKDLMGHFSVWKKRKKLYNEVQIFNSRYEAMKRLEFINISCEQNKV